MAVAVSVSVIPTATVFPAGTLPKLHVMVDPAKHVPWLGVAETMDAPVAVKAFVTITCGTAALPLFVTTISYPAVEFAGMLLGPLMEIARFAVMGGGGGVVASGIMELEGSDGRLSPSEFVAYTTNV